jgi:hypothetical protein
VTAAERAARQTVITLLAVQDDLNELIQGFRDEFPHLTAKQSAMLAVWLVMRSALIQGGIHPDYLDAFAKAQDNVARAAGGER